LTRGAARGRVGRTGGAAGTPVACLKGRDTSTSGRREHTPQTCAAGPLDWAVADDRLFISPLNLTMALGVKTLSDLEAKIISVVIVILAVSFMEHFIAERGAMTVLISAAALALVVISLV